MADPSDKNFPQAALQQSDMQFRLLVQGVTDYALYMLSPEGLVSSWNSGAQRIKGYAEHEVLGTHFSRFYTPEDAAAGLPARGLAIATREGRFENEGFRVRRDGSRFWAHVVIDAIRDEQGTLVGFAKITRDVTERRQAEQTLEETRAALFQAQKMEAVGKLTGGIAHDFNNVLQVLRGNLELMQSRAIDDAWMRDRLARASEAVDRGATLCAQLLAFGRRQPLRPAPINPARLLRGMEDMLRRVLGETIQIEMAAADGLWNVLADAHQLENVILNIALNARDAMPGGGRLTLEAANATLDEAYCNRNADIAPGRYVMLAITDTGIGMTKEIRERVFEPFFTTKPEGAGTGLGLSMAYGFVKQSGGHIKIYSEPGHGSVVKIYLPGTDAGEDPIVAPTAGAGDGGSETILVVEDHPTVRTTVVDMLASLGYAVLTADNASDALRLIESGTHVDLIFTDVVMPGALSSPEMARRAVARLPGIKVLFTSGYTRNALVHGGRLDAGVALLSKPYRREDLARRIRQLLGTAPNSQRRPLVLLVDDDCDMRATVADMLALLDYDVHTAASGAEALQAMAERPADLLLADQLLPDMPGTELAAELRRRFPGLAVVFASGRRLPSEAELGFEAARLQKPYTLDQLRGALARALNLA
ncbi:PAS domain-containing sensor histidine kinase [Pigmentiphaga soli]|uniref:histidine kinase n=1 Tax=Pigmentiphaga soli TaxID=1007095 RepID=A0ABP8HAI4_9BURK